MRQLNRRAKVAMMFTGVALMLGLSACSSVASSGPEPSPSAKSTHAKSVDLRAAALAANDGGRHIGGRITSREAAALLAAAKDYSAYQLRSGQWVLTSLSKPLPSNVTADANAVASRELKKYILGKTGHARINAEGLALIRISSSALDSPHRQAVSLVHAWSGVPGSFPAQYHQVWVVNGIYANGFQVSSKSAGIAAFKKYLKHSTQLVPPALVIADLNA